MKISLLKLLLTAITTLGFIAFTQAETTDNIKEKANQETVQATSSSANTQSSILVTETKAKKQTTEKTKTEEEEPECD